MAQQIKSILEATTWHDGGDVVFGNQGSVACFAGTPTADQMPEALPGALVLTGDYEHDDDDHSLLTQTFQVMVAVEVAGDPMGEFAVIGGSAPDLNESGGRGSAEVSERVRSALQDLTGANGAKIMLSGGGGGGAQPLGDGRHVAYASVTLDAICTSQLAYAAPQQFAVAGSSWTWEGAHCSDRFDFVEYVMGYAATAPTTTADLDAEVYRGPNASVTAAQVAGQNYAVFAIYSARGQAGVEEGESALRVGATLTT